MSKINAAATPSAELDRDVAAVGASIRRLIRHLDAEPEIALRAAEVLAEIGPYAADPLAAAMSRSPSHQQRALIFALLARLGPPGRVAVGKVLLKALKG